MPRRDLPENQSAQLREAIDELLTVSGWQLCRVQDRTVVESCRQLVLKHSRGQTGGAQLPADLPPQAVAEIQRLVHDVFVSGYVSAMRPTVLVAVVALLIASLSCLALVNRVRTAVIEPVEAAA